MKESGPKVTGADVSIIFADMERYRIQKYDIKKLQTFVSDKLSRVSQEPKKQEDESNADYLTRFDIIFCNDEPLKMVAIIMAEKGRTVTAEDIKKDVRVKDISLSVIRMNIKILKSLLPLINVEIEVFFDPNDKKRLINNYLKYTG